MTTGSAPVPTRAPTPEQWLAAHPAAAPAERAAVQLLAAMERRALSEVESTLAPGFTMVFPGPAEYHDLAAMVQGASGRYQRIAKLVEAVESFPAGGPASSSETSGARQVVYVRGTLYGVNIHGVEFAGVRYIDRFELAAGRFSRQDVWNDLAESGVLTRTD